MTDRYKLRDRVRFTGPPAMELPQVGATGVIVEILPPDAPYRYRVRWDEPVRHGAMTWNAIPMRENELTLIA